MAESSYIPFPDKQQEDDDDDDERKDIQRLDSLPYRSHIYVSDTDPLPSSSRRNTPTVRNPDIFDTDLVGRTLGPFADSSESESTDLFDRENQVNFVMDLFQQRVEQSSVMEINRIISERINEMSLGVIEENDEMLVDCFGTEIGVGLGIDPGLEEDDNCVAYVLSDPDGYIVARRESSDDLVEGNRFLNGLRVVGIDSDSEEDGNDILGVDLHSDDDYTADNVNDDDINIPLYWDSFHLEDNRDVNDEFEWEEVDGRVDEREVLSVVADPEEEESLSVLGLPGLEEEGGEDRDRGFGNLEWEVLLNLRYLERNPETDNDAGPYFINHDDYTYPAEYDMVFGQFGVGENGFAGRPPASKSVIESLPSVTITQADVLNNNALCAVCKDEISVGEQGKQLPCSHRYHGDCIIPWLGIRNTCPVCRHEMPTDDPDYEMRRAR